MSFKQLYFAAGLVLLSSAAFSQMPERYKTCSGLATSDPAQGLAAAESWLKESDNPSARHCQALALYNQGEYVSAAEILEKLAEQLGQKQDILWLNLMQQAAMARELAGQGKTAMGLLDRTLKLSESKSYPQQTALLLTSRGRILMKMGDLLEAMQDFDHALALAPTDLKLRIERVKLLQRLGDTDSARKELEIILNSDPANIQAQALRKALP